MPKGRSGQVLITIPDLAGEASGGPLEVSPFGDVLETDTLPEHLHAADVSGAGDHQHNLTSLGGKGGSSGEFRRGGGGEPDPGSVAIPSMRTLVDGSHDHDVSLLPSGGGGPHYHPFRTVLFCRKQ